MSEQTQVAVSDKDIALFYDETRMRQMLTMAKEFYQAGCFGADVKNAHHVLVKIQAGFEMGMAPIEAMNSLYIVNGHIAPWGMAQSKMLKKKGWSITYEDEEDEKGNPIACKVTVKKGDEIHTYNAKKSEVEGKKAFGISPKNKLRWHGLGQIIRFDIPEVTDAGFSYTAEDAQDFDNNYPGATVIEQPTNKWDAEEIIADIEKSTNEEGLAVIVERLNEIHGGLLKEEQDSIKEKIIEKRKSFVKKPQRKPDGTLVEAEIGMTEVKKEGNEIVDAKLEEVSIPKEKIDQETGEILEPEAPASKKVRIGPDYSNYTPEQFKKLIDKLSSRAELEGFRGEINTAYMDGNITHEVANICAEAIREKMDKIIK